MKVEIDGLKINYLESEDVQSNNPPIIFVHGWGGSIESLRALYSVAIKYKYKAYILDLPGFGSSDAPKGIWGVEEYASLLEKFMQKMGLVNAIYFGHSFGGGLGAYIAGSNPDLISRLILCSAAVQREPRESRSSRLVKKVIPNYDDVKEKLRPARKLYYKIFYPLSDTLKNPELENSYRKIITQNLTDKLSLVRQPTLILWGDQDQYTPVADAYMIHEAISGSVLKVYEGIGHALPLKYPEKVFTEVDNFIRSNK